MKSLKFLFSIFIIYAFFFLIPSASFAVENWVIDNFQSNIAIEQNGTVTITEDISVDFGSLSKHGIYRDIPYVYATNQGTNYYTDIQVLNVLQDGTDARYELQKDSNFLRLKIGDANKTISSRHSYHIQYVATGILQSFDTYDELYWNVTGNGWPVPITKASATVSLTAEGISKITCYEGVSGSTSSCVSNTVSSTQAHFESSRVLQEAEGLTIVFGYTKGLVPILQVTPSKNTSSSAATYPPNLIVIFLSFILSVGFVFRMWWKNGKEQSKDYEPVVVEYLPPEKLRPAEIGTLFDERADTLDVSATIIDLATRGFLTITEVPKRWIFGKTDYALSRMKKDDRELLAFEKKLLYKMFENDNQVNISELKENFYDDLKDVKKLLYEEVVKKGFFITNPEHVRNLYTGIAIGICVLVSIGASVGVLDPTGITSGASIGILGGALILLVLSRSFSRRTQKGHEVFRQIVGYRHFVNNAEKYRQKFFERENLFNEVLPYAIVFGATEKFAKAFKVLGIEPQKPTWYISNGNFNSTLFSSNINHFSHSLSSAIAAQPGGSGFSGGSSGGGFGGGGGGSW